VLTLGVMCALLALAAVSQELHHLAETVVGVLVH
jgi:hypothetical protein